MELTPISELDIVIETELLADSEKELVELSLMSEIEVGTEIELLMGSKEELVELMKAFGDVDTESHLP